VRANLSGKVQKTGIIYSHELRTTKAIWDGTEVVRQLVFHGYQVLAYDFRGNGDSAGQPDTSLLDVDLRSAIAFMRHHGATSIVLLGSSMGGTATLKVAADESVNALTALSAPQNFGPRLSDAEVRAIKAPKLFVNSQDANYASDTMHMYSLAAQPKEIHLYPGSEHGTSIFESKGGADLTQRILTFTLRYAPAHS
jgi:pimeloyl-ACP methyl ester carboxylesterase